MLQRCNTSPSATVTGGYFPCSYLAGGAWTNIGFRNEGDAAQTRYPDGRFFHGVSYGPNGQNMNPGGIENMRISTVNHLGRVIFFNTNDPRIAADYTSAVVAGNETPGAVNNAANGLFRATLLCPSTLPIELLDFEVHNDGTAVLLEWSTATERNNDFFTVERSPDLGSWTTVLTTPRSRDQRDGSSLPSTRCRPRDRHHVLPASSDRSGWYFGIEQGGVDRATFGIQCLACHAAGESDRTRGVSLFSRLLAVE